MLISTVLALSEFFSGNFPNIYWYPNWYLGNPYHYLIGPVVPTVLTILNIKHQILNIYLGLIGTSFLVGTLGIYLFLRDWGAGKLQAVVSGILYTVLPAGFFLLNLQNGLNHIAFGFLPFAFLLFRRFILRENSLRTFLLVFILTTMFLTSVSVILPLVIGFVAIVFAERKSYSHEKTGKTILLIILSLLLSTLWYTPKFWWVIAANPSVGGVPLGKLIWSILQFLLQFLPLVLAIFVIRLKKYKFEGYFLFGLLFFASFLFLSIVRFMSDPDFVMDWISFGLEMQFSLAVMLGNLLAKFLIFNFQFSMKISNFKFQINNVKLFIVCMGLLFSIAISLLIIKGLFVNLGSDYQSSITSILKKNVKENERVFLSGSSVFFINSKLNIRQVRGGVDQNSIHPFWAMGAYQIREGENSDLAYGWLRTFGVSYILVHDKDLPAGRQESKEPFYDFKHPEKFASCHPEFISGSRAIEIPKSIRQAQDPEFTEGQVRNDNDCVDSALFQLVKKDNGDMLYMVSNSSIGRIADLYILNVQKPKNGADNQSINNYISLFKRPLAVNSALQNRKPNEISFEENIKQGEVISLAVTYDKLWNLADGKGRIVSDSLGNMVIIPKDTGLQRFTIAYKRSFLDLAIQLGLSMVIAIILIKYQKIAPYIKKRLPKIHVGLGEKEDY